MVLVVLTWLYTAVSAQVGASVNKASPSSEDRIGNAQPLDRAWTIQTDGIRVPAPMREEVNESAQPLDLAGTYRKASIRVPAPRLELGTP